MSDELGAYDAAFDAACSRNDAERKAAGLESILDEIAMLERGLASPLPFTPAGIETMRQRLLILKAAAGLLPLK
jgi:hypothetical protein